MDESTEKEQFAQYETDNSGDESNDSEWYFKDEISLDEDDIELIKNTSEKTFGFETDHMALRGNLDYHNLIMTMSLLQAQRIKTIEDIDQLEKLRRTVRNNPREYLREFLSGNTSDIPSRIDVAQVPEIDWSKYSSKSFANDQLNSPSGSCTEEDGTSDVMEDGPDKLTVRGRVYNQSKPKNFNQLWTAEEQLRLEELLSEYPPENNENNRWRKIAHALGNRSTSQVCSRVQKYFKKLTKAGLPIPGHQLKTGYAIPSKKKKRRKNKPAERKSTFFPTQHLGAPSLLDGCEEEEEAESGLSFLTSDMKSELIEKVLGFKKKDAQLAPYSHPRIKCAGCCESPLVGTRWRCLVCASINLCSDCAIDQLKYDSPFHPPSHPLEPIVNPTLTQWDPDYTPDSFQSTNYLDPNFITTNVI